MDDNNTIPIRTDLMEEHQARQEIEELRAAALREYWMPYVLAICMVCWRPVFDFNDGCRRCGINFGIIEYADATPEMKRHCLSKHYDVGEEDLRLAGLA